jgi:conjugative transfer signal peptidase TraF
MTLYSRLLVTVAGTIGAILLGSPLLGLRLNLTESMPVGIYRVVDHPIERGATVVTCLDASNPVVHEAIRRRYFESGPCPGGLLPFLKTVAAVSGDTVDLSIDGVAVNGSALAKTKTLQADFMGRPIPHVARGSFTIAGGQVLLLATHRPASFDGRYFGPSPLAAIKSVVVPLVVAD